jgi:hypothetical protein
LDHLTSARETTRNTLHYSAKQTTNCSWSTRSTRRRKIKVTNPTRKQTDLHITITNLLAYAHDKESTAFFQAVFARTPLADSREITRTELANTKRLFDFKGNFDAKKFL